MHTDPAKLAKLIEAGKPHRFSEENPPKVHGRKNAGLSLLEWVNEMAGWTKVEVEAIRDDETAPIIKRRAAERLLDTKDVWNVVEHTHSKPVQVNQNHNETVHVRRTVIHAPGHN